MCVVYKVKYQVYAKELKIDFLGNHGAMLAREVGVGGQGQCREFSINMATILRI